MKAPRVHALMPREGTELCDMKLLDLAYNFTFVCREMVQKSGKRSILKDVKVHIGC